MRFIANDPMWDKPIVELTERNLRVLLTKLKDPTSKRTIFDPDWSIGVRVVDDSEHYKTQRPGHMAHAPEVDDPTPQWQNDNEEGVAGE